MMSKRRMFPVALLCAATAVLGAGGHVREHPVGGGGASRGEARAVPVTRLRAPVPGPEAGDLEEARARPEDHVRLHRRRAVRGPDERVGRPGHELADRRVERDRPGTAAQDADRGGAAGDEGQHRGARRGRTARSATFGDLAGKTVATINLQGLFHLGTAYAVEKAGGDPKSMRALAMSPADEPNALAAGRLDAIVLQDPFLTTAKQQHGNAFRSLGNPFAEVPYRMPVGAFWTTNNVTDSQAGAAAEVLHRLEGVCRGGREAAEADAHHHPEVHGHHPGRRQPDHSAGLDREEAVEGPARPDARVGEEVRLDPDRAGLRPDRVGRQVGIVGMRAPRRSPERPSRSGRPAPGAGRPGERARTEATAMTTKLTVLDPRGFPPKVTGQGLAPSSRRWTGKTVFLVDIGCENCDDFMGQVQGWMAGHLPRVDTGVVRWQDQHRPDRAVRADPQERGRRDPRSGPLKHVCAGGLRPRERAGNGVRRAFGRRPRRRVQSAGGLGGPGERDAAGAAGLRAYSGDRADAGGASRLRRGGRPDAGRPFMGTVIAALTPVARRGPARSRVRPFLPAGGRPDSAEEPAPGCSVRTTGRISCRSCSRPRSGRMRCWPGPATGRTRYGQVRPTGFRERWEYSVEKVAVNAVIAGAEPA